MCKSLRSGHACTDSGVGLAVGTNFQVFSSGFCIVQMLLSVDSTSLWCVLVNIPEKLASSSS
jgi:hypothetical protein